MLMLIINMNIIIITLTLLFCSLRYYLSDLILFYYKYTYICILGRGPSEPGCFNVH